MATGSILGLFADGSWGRKFIINVSVFQTGVRGQLGRGSMTTAQEAREDRIENKKIEHTYTNLHIVQQGAVIGKLLLRWPKQPFQS